MSIKKLKGTGTQSYLLEFIVSRRLHGSIINILNKAL